ncbi:hypothetical protein DBT_2356 [Dissulfuribacter thermophilus]|uniref:Uncharacterized protein n=1 Tax=Dissulfuribacter thermophilus TaxID=1156395 RepID=A0A1B9F305_9BACT|nr:hypothetical protein DBT_2356 [Dissulfuribacter thermophilus]
MLDISGRSRSIYPRYAHPIPKVMNTAQNHREKIKNLGPKIR